MKAVVYTQYGSPEVLRVEEIPKPTVTDGEILIKIYAAEVTKADCELRSFNFPVQWFWLPLRIAMGITKPRRSVPGGYFAGVVEAVGPGVSTFNQGDAVFGSAQLRMGAHGEYVSLPATYTIVPKPDNVSFAEAAAVPLGALNALHFLNRAKLQSGEKVLINGAGGSIGLFAVQIAKDRGAEVTAVDAARKEAMLRDIGVDHFVNYEQEDFTSAGKTYDVIFDMVAASSYGRCVATLTPGGRYLMGNPRISKMLRSAFTSWFTSKQATFAFAGETPQELRTLKDMIEAGKIKPVIDQVFSMHEAAEAHVRVETEQRLGCVVLVFGEG